MDPGVLQGATAVVVIDWPTKDVPDSLARAGLEVYVHGGPAADAWTSASVGADGSIGSTRTGAPPARADVVYTHRPVDELPDIVAVATDVGARAVWLHSGMREDGVRDPHGCWLSDEDRARARSVVEA